jgi:hypothetical protein
MNYPAASGGVSKTLNSVIPHLMRNPVRSSGFRLEFIPYLIRGRNDELAASGGEYNPKGFNHVRIYASSGTSPGIPPIAGPRGNCFPGSRNLQVAFSADMNRAANSQAKACGYHLCFLGIDNFLSILMR